MGDRTEKADAILTEKQRLQLAARDEFNQHAIAERHQFTNAVAALRIMLGAFAVGDLPADRYQQALARIKDRETGIDAQFSIAEHLAKMSSLRDRAHIPRGASLGDHIKPGQKILVIDDQVESAGWDMFFEGVFGPRVLFATTTQQGLELARAHGSEIAIVFLDLRMPDDPAQGIELLRQVRLAHVDLPVMVFSALEDIQSIRKCFAVGAFSFYTKELGRESGRDSIGYYEKFKEIVLEAIPPIAWRETWQLIQGLTAPAHGSSQTRLFRCVRGHLRRAYYFLTTNTHDPRLSLLCNEDRDDYAHAYSHAILESGHAVEAIVRDQFKSALRKHFGMGSARVPASTFEDKVQALRRRGVFDDGQADQAQQVWAARSAVAHGERRNQAQAIEVIRKTLAVVQPFFA